MAPRGTREEAGPFGDPGWARLALAPEPARDLPAPLGATYLDGGLTRFVVWAPHAEGLRLLVDGSERPLERAPRGYFWAEEKARPGSRYAFLFDGGRERPDPASRHQPEGLHGRSAVVDPEFPWTDAGWRGIALANHVFYELHVGAFTPEGTFDAAIPHLGELRDLGITAVELMPIGEFPGERNWGYDGAYPFAAQASYGGPDGFRRFVDAAHRYGLAVILDVVYNHFGPEGSYQAEFGPYFTDRIVTPWGRALNLDARGSDEVRRYFLENALYWAAECHVDGFRLDAVHAMVDGSASPFLRELATTVHRFGAERDRRIHLISEDDRNAAFLIEAPERGGFGLDAEWNDDVHHVLHVLLTGDRNAHYADFGSEEQLATAYREGFVYRGGWSDDRGHRYGSDSRAIPGRRFVVFAQNHDQVGNRADANRLTVLVSADAVRLAAAAVAFAPALPLLFMGEEYGETAPFPYFVSHSDPNLVEAVRAGRRTEFASLWSYDPADPQSVKTFMSAKLNHSMKSGDGARRLAYTRRLLALRREVPALARPSKRRCDAAVPAPGWVLLRRWDGSSEAAVALHFESRRGSAELPLPPGRWTRLLDSGAAEWGGDGAQAPAELVSEGLVPLELPAWTAALYVRRG